jgi:single-stranded-DNA-specific exonuclease RecJ
MTLKKQWCYLNPPLADESLLAAASGSELLAKLLLNRGISDAHQAEAFLDSAKYQPTDPYVLPDMTRAIERVMKAIRNNEKIVVYGDYDVDGVTGTCVLLTVLRSLNADVSFYIPNRINEGYGLNLKAVSILASKQRAKLILTCDCGVSNFAEINFAKSLGVETIVLDHHTMPEVLPPAVAILHPKLLSDDHPLFHLPGVGVAFKFAEALLAENNKSEDILELLDYVTLGMIADMVPLVKENRYLVQIGLPRLVNSKRAGIRALLLQVAHIEGADLVGFGLAPRINAVGRLADADVAVELLTTSDLDKAQQLAKQLENENVRRQELCETIFLEADQKARLVVEAGSKAIAIFSEGWHHGVVGIVASRLVEKYHLPAFVGELDLQEGIMKGSARGIVQLDLCQILKSNEQLAMKWGGHKMAAGFTVEAAKAELFCQALTNTCNQALAETAISPTLMIDLDINSAQISLDTCRIIQKLAPFGMENKKPIFSTRELRVRNVRSLGKEGKHLKFVIQDKETNELFECIQWNNKGISPISNDIIDIAFTPEINNYAGLEKVQLMISAWKHSFEPEDKVPLENFAPQEQTVVNESAQVAPVIKSEPQKQKIIWKDLRLKDDPLGLTQAASRKLGDDLSIFAESSLSIENLLFVDREGLIPRKHLIIWQYPPSLKVFKQIIEKSQANNIYMVAGCTNKSDDGLNFIRRLMALVRYSVNKRDGRARPNKLASAMGADKMAIALALTILKKVSVIDWFVDEGWIHFDLVPISASSTNNFEELPEFNQLANTLNEISSFRKWCSQSTLKDFEQAIIGTSENIYAGLLNQTELTNYYDKPL